MSCRLCNIESENILGFFLPSWMTCVIVFSVAGERFLESTTKMASERMTPQLKVGGPCISVAMTMGGVEGRYPEAMEVWSQREKQLRQSLEWQSFRQTTEQVYIYIYIHIVHIPKYMYSTSTFILLFILIRALLLYCVLVVVMDKGGIRIISCAL